jgi:hypothetical protein
LAFAGFQVLHSALKCTAFSRCGLNSARSCPEFAMNYVVVNEGNLFVSIHPHVLWE